jgi:hypothetical protein
VIDTLRTAHGGISPITYGDFRLDENNNEIPLETEMTFTEDYCSKQCLDYLLLIKKARFLKEE